MDKIRKFFRLSACALFVFAISTGAVTHHKEENGKGKAVKSEVKDKDKAKAKSGPCWKNGTCEDDKPKNKEKEKPKKEKK